MKRALVLSGGGVKGAYQVGALKKWLLEDNLDYEILRGVSVGALNVAKLSEAKLGDVAQAYTRLLDLWGIVNDGRIFKSWKPFGVAHSLWLESVLNGAPIMEMVTQNLNETEVAGSGRDVAVGTTSWNSGEYRMARGSEPDFAKWVVASASFPIFLSPVELEGQLWTDGGIRNVTPLSAAIEAGADEIDVIMTSDPDLPTPWDTKGKHAIPDYIERAFDLMNDQIMRSDLKICGLKNDLAGKSKKYRKVKIRVLKPKEKLVENSLSFDRTAIKRMIEKGYEDACALGV